jgi:hypothetical protein
MSDASLKPSEAVTTADPAARSGLRRLLAPIGLTLVIAQVGSFHDIQTWAETNYDLSPFGAVLAVGSVFLGLWAFLLLSVSADENR